VSAHQTIDVDISESVCPNDMVPFAAAGKFSPQRWVLRLPGNDARSTVRQQLLHGVAARTTIITDGAPRLTAPHCILSKVEFKFSFYLGHGFKDFSRLMVEPQTSGFIVINSGLSCLGSTDIAKSPWSHGKWSFVAVTDVFGNGAKLRQCT